MKSLLLIAMLAVSISSYATGDNNETRVYVKVSDGAILNENSSWKRHRSFILNEVKNLLSYSFHCNNITLQVDSKKEVITGSANCTDPYIIRGNADVDGNTKWANLSLTLIMLLRSDSNLEMIYQETLTND